MEISTEALKLEMGVKAEGQRENGGIYEGSTESDIVCLGLGVLWGRKWSSALDSEKAKEWKKARERAREGMGVTFKIAYMEHQIPSAEQISWLTTTCQGVGVGGGAVLITLLTDTFTLQRLVQQLYPCWPRRTLSHLNIDCALRWDGRDRHGQKGQENVGYLSRSQPYFIYSHIQGVFRVHLITFLFQYYFKGLYCYEYFLLLNILLVQIHELSPKPLLQNNTLSKILKHLAIINLWT